MRSEKFQAPAPTTNNPEQADAQQLPTFLDHVHELRRRLFWVVGIVLVASSAAYSFLGTILEILTQPLGDERLFYLTPGGGLSFSFKLCALVGLLVAVPLIMYHLYRFLEPLMGAWRRSALFYVGFSTALAVSGVLFAYFVSLPAAIKFLTGFSVNHIQAMLTADSYLSFVATYLLGAALLFQIPLLLLIINTMTPLKPSKLMKLQKFVIVGAFIIGAMISPTPDIMNQAFLAVPIIAMYQLGVILVWIQNGARSRKQARIAAATGVQEAPQPKPVPSSLLEDFAMQQQARQQEIAERAAELAAMQKRRPAVPQLQRAQPRPQAQQQPVRPQPVLRRAPQQARIISDIAPRRQAPVAMRPAVNQVPVQQPMARSVVRQAPQLSVPARSIDGFSPYRQTNVASAS
jgi:sec-independent protein translocase protein TatC